VATSLLALQATRRRDAFVVVTHCTRARCANARAASRAWSLSQRVPGEFAARLGGEEGAAAAAVVLLVSPLGKVWRAELRHAGGGGGPWQLGGGWAGFAAAHGIEAG